MEPAVYKLVYGGARIIFTGLMTHVFVGKLRLQKWVSLGLLTVGVCLGSFNPWSPWSPSVQLAPLLLQACVSSAASIYLMMLLKKSRSLNRSNRWLYAWGVLLNLGCVYFTIEDIDGGVCVFSALNVCTILLGSIGGVCVSILLRQLDSIAKEIVNAITIITIAIAQWTIFGTRPTYTLLPAFVIISYAIRMYSIDMTTTPI
tara:strand:- start:4200 stop:4805 length:606 start_codon:yes stop_codon:yes gene_type:complete